MATATLYAPVCPLQNCSLLFQFVSLCWRGIKHQPIVIVYLSFPSDFNSELQYAKQDLPTYEDLNGAAMALMRLQDTYHLDTSKIAHGNLGGVVSSSLSGTFSLDYSFTVDIYMLMNCKAIFLPFLFF